jgi:tryptophan halogenase
VIKRVVIVGGGSAGWLTAGLIATEHRSAEPGGLQVTVLESPDVASIGVGEGTWPTMRDTLRRIGVSETDFVRECDASFKQGSKFVGWVTGATGDHYYHPFMLPQGYTETNLVAQWQARHAERRFAEVVSHQPHLCEQHKAPKQIATPEFAAVANYAYHLDAGKFGRFLQHHCTGRLGVRHVQDHVTGIHSSDDGDIASLATREHGNVEGDLFIDCTGFLSLLLGKHYGVPFVSRKDVLFNDSALALQVPYADDNSPIASHTISTAQAAGWIWDIGLPTRRGVGYVYSSAHTTDAAAESALRAYVLQGAGPAAALALEPRKLSFNPGYRAKFWHRNCVAVGMSAGFIEPLEASALALIEMAAAMISDEMPATRAAMDIAARRFNDAFEYRWGRVIEFLKLHYVLSGRSDAYWVDIREPATVPQRLRELLALWRHQPPSRHDFYRVEEIFPSASYQYVLYGMGFQPEPRAHPRRVDDAALAERFFGESAALAGKLLAGLPSNRELLQQIAKPRMQRI